MEELKNLSDNELIVLRKEVEKEMHSRGISFSVGQIGEEVAIRYFCSTPGLPNLMHGQTGGKNVDAYSRDGDRYSIKTSLKARKTGTIYPDSNNPDKQLFEYLLVVKLSPDFTLEALYRFSWSQFLKIRAWDKRINAWYVPISQTRLNTGECLITRMSELYV